MRSAGIRVVKALADCLSEFIRVGLHRMTNFRAADQEIATVYRSVLQTDLIVRPIMYRCCTTAAWRGIRRSSRDSRSSKLFRGISDIDQRYAVQAQAVEKDLGLIW